MLTVQSFYHLLNILPCQLTGLTNYFASLIALCCGFGYVYYVPVQLSLWFGMTGFMISILLPVALSLMLYARRHREIYIADRWEVTGDVDSYLLLKGVKRRHS